VANAAIQPRSLPKDLFSPLPLKQSSGFSQTKVIVATPDVVDTEARVTVPLVPDLHQGPVLFDSRPDAKRQREGRLVVPVVPDLTGAGPVVFQERRPRQGKQSGLFSETVPIVPKTDEQKKEEASLRTVEEEVSLFQPRPDAKKALRSGKQLSLGGPELFSPVPTKKSSPTVGFTQTDAVVAAPNDPAQEPRRGRVLDQDSSPHLFSPVPSKNDNGRAVTNLTADKQASLFESSLSSSSHSVSAVPDSPSKSARAPKEFTFGVGQ